MGIGWISLRRSSRLSLLLILVSSAFARGQTKPVPDKNTPKSALLDLHTACMGGDRAKLLALIHAPSPGEQKAAQALVELLLAECQ
jgi:hypothetical protein